MKVYPAALFLCLSGVCFLVDYPAYASPLKSDNEQMEPYLEKLQANIIEEEKALESLKIKYEDILSKKQGPKEQKVKKENKEPNALQSEKIATETKLKDLESAQHSLRQKNQELLNSLEQSIDSIQNKNRTIEELKKTRLAPPKKEVFGRQAASREGDYSKEEALTRKQLDKLQKEKISLEGQLKALKEERKIRLAREVVQPEPLPAKKVNEKQKKEIKENSFSKKNIKSKDSENDRTSSFDMSQKNKPGILKGFLDKSKKLDSWWREKVW